MDDKVKVGQKLWLVDKGRHYDHSREVTVTKVGRVWAEAEGERVRFDAASLRFDGYVRSREIWRSRDEYESKLALNKEWEAFWSRLRGMYSRPEGLTIERLRIATEALWPEKDPANEAVGREYGNG